MTGPPLTHHAYRVTRYACALPGNGSGVKRARIG